MDMISENSQENLNNKKKIGRKRKISSQNSPERKKLCNNNQRYVNRKGSTVEPKNFVPVLSCCAKKCHKKVAVLSQEKFFNDFNNAGSFELRSSILNYNVEEKPITTRTTTAEESRKTSSRVYNLNYQPVCKKFFLQVLQISSSRVDGALTKWKSSNVKDQRGHHENHKKYPVETRDAVINHIKSFPRYVSHYKRETSDALYLHPSLSLSKMYELFQIDWKNNKEDILPPSRQYYQEAFKSLNLKFKPLKSDTCKTCDMLSLRLQNASGQEKENISKTLHDHQEKAEYLQKKMKDDFAAAKGNPRLQSLAFDLQKVLQLPKAPTNILFYMRNLCMFNLGIHDGSTDDGYFHTWLETTAGRGSQEIVSCILKHLNQHLKPTTETLILWCDSCGGQNRNHILCIMLQRFLSRQAKLKEISIRFLCSGHSYMSCDRDFGSVEKAVRKEQEIFTDQDYIELMKNCRSSHKFNVTEMKADDFQDAKPVLALITKRDKDESSKEKVSWLKTHQVRLNKNHPFKFFMKYELRENQVI